MEPCQALSSSRKPGVGQHGSDAAVPPVRYSVMWWNAICPPVSYGACLWLTSWIWRTHLGSITRGQMSFAQPNPPSQVVSVMDVWFHLLKWMGKANLIRKASEQSPTCKLSKGIILCDVTINLLGVVWRSSSPIQSQLRHDLFHLGSFIIWRNDPIRMSRALRSMDRYRRIPSLIQCCTS